MQLVCVCLYFVYMCCAFFGTSIKYYVLGESKKMFVFAIFFFLYMEIMLSCCPQISPLLLICFVLFCFLFSFLKNVYMCFQISILIIKVDKPLPFCLWLFSHYQHSSETNATKIVHGNNLTTLMAHFGRNLSMCVMCAVCCMRHALIRFD